MICATKFIESFISFADSTSLPYSREGCCFYFEGNDITFHLVPLGEVVQIAQESLSQDRTLYLFEDRWWREGALLRQRLLAHLGVFRSIFARNCEVKEVTSDVAATFLERYHSYGWARCKYKYGLYFKGELVAVSTFSAPRKMKRVVASQEVSLDSYEWVRYASLPDCRISGGMGKLLQKFVEEVHPQEVMSYADREWSEGGAYKKLGFNLVETKSPIEFYINTLTWDRISLKKVQCDKAFRNIDLSSSHFVKIQNLGSYKYLKLLL